MKCAYLGCVIQFLTTTFLLSQQNPVPAINQTARVASLSSASQADPNAQARILDSYGKLPLSFEVNHGQTDVRVKFLSRTSGYTLFLTGDEAVLALSGKTASPDKAKVAGVAHNLHSVPAAPKAGGVLRMKLRNANPEAKVTGVNELAGTSNYFIGNDPAKWRTNVPTYAKVKYEEIYSGIDLVYYGNQRQLEYDFVVAPGADPSRIKFDVHGAKRIRRDAQGDLVLTMGEGEIRWHKPTVYQEKDGVRQLVAARYAITDKNRVGFAVAEYDSGRALYIDPLIYSTYLGGSGRDVGFGVAVDSAGNAYVTGVTASTNFPITPGAFQTTSTGEDAFVTKLNSTGSALVYSTYLGGSGLNSGGPIAVDSAGNAYVAGITDSTDFPITPGAFQTVCNQCAGVNWDGFVTKLNPSGSALVYSTYLGGSGVDQINGIAVDGSGDAYVAGVTSSTNFPTTPGAFQPNCAGVCNIDNPDAFVTELNSTGSALVYSTYLGGSGEDSGTGIAVDSAGDAYVNGFTCSTDFPVTPGAFQTTYNSSSCVNLGGNAFVTKLNSTGSALVYSTYLGGSGEDSGTGIAVDSAGDAYVTGSTTSTNFPTMNPLQPANGGGYDAFVIKLNSTGSALVYSTYLGGSGSDSGTGIAVDSAGNAYVTGGTSSTNFPTFDPLQPANGGGGDAFVSKLNPSGSALVYSTYLGGSGGDNGFGIAVDSAGNAYVTGITESTDFPTMNPFQPTYGGGNSGGIGDAFVSKIAKPSAVVSLAPPSLGFGDQPLGIASSPQVSTLTNAGELTLTITSIQVTGANGGDFAQTNNCGTSVPAGGSCDISVAFTPTVVGTRTGQVTITDNAADSPQTISLTGIGVTSPTTTLLTSAPNPSALGQAVTLTATVTTSGSTAPTGTVTFYDGTTTLGTSTLNGSGIATYTTSSLSVGQHSMTAVYGGDANNAGSTSSVLTQTVNAADFTLTSNPTSATVTAGQSGTFTLTVTPQGSFTSPISFSCSGLPALAGCTFKPASVTPNSSTATSTLTITTTAQTASLASPFRRRSSSLYAMLLVLPAMLLGRVGMAAPKRRKLLSYCLAFVLVGGCLLQVACGGGSNGGGSGRGGTPPGTYTVTVTGAAGSTQHTTAVTLTVQ